MYMLKLSSAFVAVQKPHRTGYLKGSLGIKKERKMKLRERFLIKA
jgi:hypothetical protein